MDRIPARGPAENGPSLRGAKRRDAGSTQAPCVMADKPFSRQTARVDRFTGYAGRQSMKYKLISA